MLRARGEVRRSYAVTGDPAGRSAKPDVHTRTVARLVFEGREARVRERDERGEDGLVQRSLRVDRGGSRRLVGKAGVDLDALDIFDRELRQVGDVGTAVDDDHAVAAV